MDWRSELREIGFIYIAFGSKYIHESTASATSLKRHMPEAQVALITDRDSQIDGNIFNDIIRLDQPLDGLVHPRYYGFWNKIRGISASPYPYTVFVDSDTCFGGAVWDLFEMLSHYDLAIAPAPVRYYLPSLSLAEFVEVQEQGKVPMTALNTGVMAFRQSDAMKDFLQDWEQLYIQKAPVNGDDHYTDQTIVRDALATSRVRMITLNPEFNFRIAIPQVIQGLVKIFHGRPQTGWEAQVEFINSWAGRRVYYPNQMLMCLKPDVLEIRPFSKQRPTVTMTRQEFQARLLGDYQPLVEPERVNYA